MAGSENRPDMLAKVEHDKLSDAKKVILRGLLDGGSEYGNVTVAEFPAKGRNALEVILVNTAGDLYDATGGGGSAQITVDVRNTVNVTETNPQVTAHILNTVNVTETNPQVTASIAQAAPDASPEGSTFYVAPDGAGAPTQFPNIGTNLFGGVAIYSPATNATAIWVGKSTVTTGIGGVGAMLEPGMSLTVPCRESQDVYAMADGTVTLFLTAVGVPG